MKKPEKIRHSGPFCVIINLQVKYSKKTDMHAEKPLPSPEEITGFPEVKGARLEANGRHLYVTVREKYTRPDGTAAWKQRILGKVAEGRFYTLGEYAALFKKNGERRITADSAPPKPEGVRSYVRKKPLVNDPRRSKDVPPPESIENFPHDHPRARVLKRGTKLYVVESVYVRDEAAGRSREVRTYLGTVEDGRFVPRSEAGHTRRRRSGTEKKD